MKSPLRTINLLVADTARSSTFYAQVLGLTENPESEPPHMRLLDTGGCTLSLETDPQPKQLEGRVELGFEVEDVDAVWQAFKDYGLENVGEVRELSFGRMFDACDPDGHRLSIYKMATAET